MRRISFIVFCTLLSALPIFADTQSVDAVKKLVQKADISGKATIAVLPVTDLTKGSSVNQKALYGDIVMTLQELHQFILVDRSAIKHIMKEKELEAAGLVASKDTEIGTLANADYILSTVIEQGVVELKLVKVKDGVVAGYHFFQVSTDRSYGSAMKPGDVTIQTGWLTSEAYQAYFDARLKFGYYPVEVWGRTNGNTMQFKGVYKINVNSYYWYTHHGMIKNFFLRKKSEYSRQGFKIAFQSTFLDQNGLTRYNAVWIRQ